MSQPSTDFTIADVLAWARTRAADEQYEYWCDRCAIGQFLTDTGRACDPSMGETWWKEHATPGVSGRHEIDPAINNAAEEGEHTFGELVKRLEVLVPTPAHRADWVKLDTYMADIEQVAA